MHIPMKNHFLTSRIFPALGVTFGAFGFVATLVGQEAVWLAAVVVGCAWSGVGVCILIRSMVARTRVRAFHDWGSDTKKYWIEPTLKLAGRHKMRLEVLARTAFRWLCGSERDFEVMGHGDIKQATQARHNYERGVVGLKKALHDAVEEGAEIAFVLQCPEVEMRWWADQPDKVEKNREHFCAAVKEFLDTVSNWVSPGAKRQFTLLITKRPIPSSMVRLKCKGSKDRCDEIRRLVVDLGWPYFMNEDSGDTLKPFAVFERRRGSIQDYLRQFDSYLVASEEALCRTCQHSWCPMCTIRQVQS